MVRAVSLASSTASSSSATPCRLASPCRTALKKQELPRFANPFGADAVALPGFALSKDNQAVKNKSHIQKRGGEKRRKKKKKKKEEEEEEEEESKGGGRRKRQTP